MRCHQVEEEEDGSVNKLKHSTLLKYLSLNRLASGFDRDMATEFKTYS